ncbi:MAG: hypothetical protein ACXADL_05170 [Candidatus Thorarchaeota archaeon]
MIKEFARRKKIINGKMLVSCGVSVGIHARDRMPRLKRAEADPGAREVGARRKD